MKKKIARKIYLDPDLVELVDLVADCYSIPKSNLIEDLLINRLYPERSMSIRIQLIENDDYYATLREKFEGRICNDF